MYKEFYNLALETELNLQKTEFLIDKLTDLQSFTIDEVSTEEMKYHLKSQRQALHNMGIGFSNVSLEDFEEEYAVVTEGLKDTVKTIIVWVRKLINKVINNLKKLGLKALNFITGYVDRTKTLMAEFKANELANKRGEYSRGRSAKINAMFATVLTKDLSVLKDPAIVLSSRGNDVKVVDFVIDYTGAVTDPKSMESKYKDLEKRSKENTIDKIDKGSKKGIDILLANTDTKALYVNIEKKECGGKSLYNVDKLTRKVKASKTDNYKILSRDDYINMCGELIIASEDFGGNLDAVSDKLKQLDSEFEKVDTLADYDKCTTIQFNALRKAVLTSTSIGMSAMMYKYDQISNMFDFLKLSLDEWNTVTSK